MIKDSIEWGIGVYKTGFKQYRQLSQWRRKLKCTK